MIIRRISDNANAIGIIIINSKLQDVKYIIKYHRDDDSIVRTYLYKYFTTTDHYDIFLSYLNE